MTSEIHFENAEQNDPAYLLSLATAIESSNEPMLGVTDSAVCVAALRHYAATLAAAKIRVEALSAA